MSGMSDTLIDATYDPENNESTGNYSIPARASENRIKKLYAESIDFLRLTHSLRDYIIANNDRVAARAFKPASVIGGNRGNPDVHDPLAIVLFYWHAACDQSVTLRSVDDRKCAFLRALRDLQRNGNLVVRQNENNQGRVTYSYVDDNSQFDFPSCATGVRNKFVEVFSGMHPAVRLHEDINLSATHLLRGFIVDIMYGKGFGYTDLIADDLDLNDSLGPNALIEIKNRVLRVYGELIDDNIINYLNQTLSAENLQYYSFDSNRKNGANSFQKFTPEELNECRSNSMLLLRTQTTSDSLASYIFDHTIINAIQQIAQTKFSQAGLWPTHRTNTFVTPMHHTLRHIPTLWEQRRADEERRRLALAAEAVARETQKRNRGIIGRP